MRSLLTVCLLSAYCTYTLAFNSNIPDEKKRFGGVVSNGRECGPIGRDILNKGGNAIDSAIAVLLCEGVTGPQSMGIGGGFLATVYIKSKNLITTINAREAAPKNVSETMFKGLKEIKGGHASAIPSEIKGYWELKKKFGNPKILWSELLMPTIDLCKNGYIVDSFLARVLKKYRKQIFAEPSLKAVFVNNQTNKVYKAGERAFRPQLGETLLNISKGGAQEFYGGVTGQNFIDDVRAMGGILTMQDLIDYEVREREPVTGKLNEDLTLYSVPLPGSGPVLNTIVQLLRGRVEGVDNATLIYRMAEAMKHAYGLRLKLADGDVEPSARLAAIEAADLNVQEKLRKIVASDDHQTHNNISYYGSVFEPPKDHGTSNVAVIDRDGNGITVTSTVNNVFGAFVRSNKTGIILNDEMDDFSTPNVTNAYGYPPTSINFIKPGKRPMSSMSPSIIVDKKGDIRLLVGAAGGSQITTSVAQAIVRNLFLKEDIFDAVNGLRIHHQLVPNKLMYEKGRVSEDVLQELRNRGHVVDPKFLVDIQGFSAVTAIAASHYVESNGVVWQYVHPTYDERRGGSSATTDGWQKISENVVDVDEDEE